jgi:hypothetical protein
MNIQESFNEINKLSTDFMEIYEREEKELPYQINLIDELHAKENAHSRILNKLLQRNVKGDSKKFEILRSLIQYITKKHPDKEFKNIKIEEPNIMSEKQHIDLWICDKGYAIIFENKIHWAKDQKKQLSRYIEETLKTYKKEQIYLIYLSPISNKDPEEQSWGEYKEDFKNRYLKLSFKDDILTWLKDDVLPNIRRKDTLLSSALDQYIDYLEGLFSLRTINNKMNMELQNFIRERLKLQDSPEIDITILNKKKDEFTKVINQIDSLITEENQKIVIGYLTQWAKQLEKDYPEYGKISVQTDGPLCHWISVLFEGKGDKFSVYIQNDGQGLYYGIRSLVIENDGNGKESDEMIEFLNTLIKSLDSPEKWNPDRKFTTFENGYTDFKRLIDNVIKFLKQDASQK